jgi:hypothetical protein
MIISRTISKVAHKPGIGADWHLQNWLSPYAVLVLSALVGALYLATQADSNLDS